MLDPDGNTSPTMTSPPTSPNIRKTTVIPPRDQSSRSSSSKPLKSSQSEVRTKSFRKEETSSSPRIYIEGPGDDLEEESTKSKNSKPIIQRKKIEKKPIVTATSVAGSAVPLFAPDNFDRHSFDVKEFVERTTRKCIFLDKEEREKEKKVNPNAPAAFRCRVSFILLLISYSLFNFCISQKE